MMGNISGVRIASPWISDVPRNTGDALPLADDPLYSLPLRVRRWAAAGISRLRPRSPCNDSSVSGQRKKLIAELILESIHHRQDHDQRSHADANTGKGNPRDEGDKELVTAGPRITQAHEQRQWVKHRRDLTTIG